MKILVETPAGIVRDTFFTPENIRILNSLGIVMWNDSGKHLSAHALRDALEDVDAIVCSWGIHRFDSFVLEKANRLKVIAYVCGSVNHIVTDEVFDRGIHVLSGNEEFARSVAEGILCYMLVALRRIPQTVQSFSEKGWPSEYTVNESLLEQNMGIVGLGAISRYLIGYLKPFDVRIKLFSNHTTAEEAAALGVQKASLEEIFSTCKIISINSARSPKNYHMISDELMGHLKPDSLLFNTSRGDLIDEKAMAEHLKQNHFRAILDVYEEEPLPMGSPLWGMENAILIPHQGGPTTDRRAAAARIVIEDIRNMLEGRPLKQEISCSRAATMTHQ